MSDPREAELLRVIEAQRQRLEEQYKEIEQQAMEIKILRQKIDAAGAAHLWQEQREAGQEPTGTAAQAPRRRGFDAGKIASLLGPSTRRLTLSIRRKRGGLLAARNAGRRIFR